MAKLSEFKELCHCLDMWQSENAYNTVVACDKKHGNKFILICNMNNYGDTTICHDSFTFDADKTFTKAVISELHIECLDEHIIKRFPFIMNKELYSEYLIEIDIKLEDMENI